MQTAISVACAGDKTLARVLRIIAAERNVRVADIVRDALDAHVGGDIQRILTENVPFFAESIASTQHFSADKELA